MSIQVITETLSELIKIHEKLIKQSKEKTEVIKEGSIEKLQTILSRERQCVQELEKLESKRAQQVNVWTEKNGLTDENMTITKMLKLIKNPLEAKQLELKTIALTEMITILKQQEQLNEELIMQSMQFVQLSLDMMSPTINNLNYGKNQETSTVKRSVFDSKA